MTDKHDMLRDYRNAGQNFLAYRLEHVFKELATPADIALHNDVIAEVMHMARKEAMTPHEARTRELHLVRQIAHLILYGHTEGGNQTQKQPKPSRLRRLTDFFTKGRRNG